MFMAASDGVRRKREVFLAGWSPARRRILMKRMCHFQRSFEQTGIKNSRWSRKQGQSDLF